MKNQSKQQHSMGKINIVVTSIVAIALVYIYANYTNDVHRARERLATGNHVVDTPCGRIEYAVSGPENNPPVLTIHGSGGGFDQGLLVGKPLAERGYRIIAPSRFGYLLSPPPDTASHSSQAQAYACLLDALDIDKVTGIVGTSTGVPSSLKFAQEYPERCGAVALVVPTSTSLANHQKNEPFMKLPHGLLSLVMLGLLKNDFLYWMAAKYASPVLIQILFATPAMQYYKAPQSEKARVHEFLDQMLPVSSRSTGMNLEESLLWEPIFQPTNIATPVLLISHKDDPYGTYHVARALWEGLPNARFVSYPHGGHMGVGYTNEVYSEITSFFQAHTKNPTSHPMSYEHLQEETMVKLEALSVRSHKTTLHLLNSTRRDKLFLPDESSYQYQTRSAKILCQQLGH